MAECCQSVSWPDEAPPIRLAGVVGPQTLRVPGCTVSGGSNNLYLLTEHTRNIPAAEPFILWLPGLQYALLCFPNKTKYREGIKGGKIEWDTWHFEFSDSETPDSYFPIHTTMLYNTAQKTKHSIPLKDRSSRSNTPFTKLGLSLINWGSAAKTSVYRKDQR